MKVEKEQKNGVKHSEAIAGGDGNRKKGGLHVEEANRKIAV